MKTATGIFPSRSAAELAMNKLRSLGIPENQLSLLTPGDKNNQHDSLPTTEGEQPGMGKVIGGVVGGALGLSGGVPLGAAIATLLFPGVGPVLAIGFITAAITGTAGVAGGAIAGGALENALTNGLPRDELYLYEDALRQGRTILMFRTEDDGELESGSKILAETAPKVSMRLGKSGGLECVTRKRRRMTRLRILLGSNRFIAKDSKQLWIFPTGARTTLKR